MSATYKKGDKRDIENYRHASFLNLWFKIYTTILKFYFHYKTVFRHKVTVYPPPPSSFHPPPSSLQHPRHYLNQNITFNWAFSPNLGGKIQSCPFCLKIDQYGILEVLIPNPNLDFWYSHLKVYFCANLSQKNWKLFILPENWHT